MAGNQIGHYEEILKCHNVWQFMTDYCPTSALPVEVLRKWGRTLAEELELGFDDSDHFVPEDDLLYREEEEDADDAFEDSDPNETTYSVPISSRWFGHKPSASKRDTSEYFNEYIHLCDRIEARGIEKIHCNNVVCSSAQSNHFRSKFKTSGCLVKKTTVAEDTASRHLRATDILAVMQYKKYRKNETILDNRSKVMSAVQNVMFYDVRRMFMYAISVEDCWMTIYYFARDHCIPQYKATMLSIFLSFMCATEEDLGIDPRIHLRPPQINRPVQFIYELQDGNQKKYYRTLRSISGPSYLRIIGRTTRVFEVVEVDSESDDAVRDDRPRQVIKDAWLAANRETESEIQLQIFADIQKFIELPASSQREHLAAWTQNDGDLYPGIAQYMGKGAKDFRELFLCIKLESTAPALREIHHDHLRLPSKTFFEKSKEVLNGTLLDTSSLSSNAPPMNQRDVQAPRSRKTDSQSRLFSEKKRTFILFDCLCQPIHGVPSVGAAFHVLADTAIALFLMYLGGWVHRDISSGNVMAFHNKQTNEWDAKLGDLEYAKRFTDTFESTNSKTGTPYFMAAEILRDFYFSRDDSPWTWDQFLSILTTHYDFPDTKKKQGVIHNFYHDVESLFWIGYWIVTCCVGHQPSKMKASHIFLRSAEPNAHRDIALSSPFPDVMQLLPNLKEVVPLFENLRKGLYSDMVNRNDAGLWMTHLSYRGCHLMAFTTFKVLDDSERPGYHVKLKHEKSLRRFNPLDPPSECISAISITVSPKKYLKGQKRGRDQDEDGEDKEARKGAKTCSERTGQPPAAFSATLLNLNNGVRDTGKESGMCRT